MSVKNGLKINLGATFNHQLAPRCPVQQKINGFTTFSLAAGRGFRVHSLKIVGLKLLDHTHAVKRAGRNIWESASLLVNYAILLANQVIIRGTYPQLVEILEVLSPKLLS